MNPNYTIQTVVDVRVIASLARVLVDEFGVNDVRTVANLVRRLLYSIHDTLLDSGAAKPFKETVDAVNYLADRGFSVKQLKNCKGRGLVKSLNLELLRKNLTSNEDVVEPEADSKAAMTALLMEQLK